MMARVLLALVAGSQQTCATLAPDTLGLHAPAAEADATSGAVRHGCQARSGRPHCDTTAAQLPACSRR